MLCLCYNYKQQNRKCQYHFVISLQKFLIFCFLRGTIVVKKGGETMEAHIKELRKSLGMTQQEFADRLHIKRGAIANYEVGRNIPTDSVIALICREFGVSETWLRTGEGDMFPPRDALQELTEMAGRFLGNQPTEIQQRAARMLFNLRPDDWELIEKRARELLGE